MGGTYDTRLKKDVSCWIGSEVFLWIGIDVELLVISTR